MIFKRTLQRELIFYSSAVYAGLTLVTLTFTMIRLLTQAVDGKIDPQSVFVLLGFALVNFQALIMSLSVFIGTLLVYSRMWRDSEMTVWQSSGLSLRQFVEPTLRFAFPIALLAAVFSLLIAPWANQQANQYRDVFSKRNDLSRIAAQQFKENNDGSRVFYVGHTDENTHQVSNIFILEKNLPQKISAKNVIQNKQQKQEQQEQAEEQKTKLKQDKDSTEALIKLPTNNTEKIITAVQGEIYIAPEGEQYLQLLHGQRYQLPVLNHVIDLADTRQTMQTQTTSLMQFDQYRTLLMERPANNNAAERPIKQQNTLNLLGDTDPAAQSEMLWRLSGPIICLMLAFLAVPLSYFNPRSGKSAPLVTAVLLFVVYLNTVSLTQNYLQAGKIKPWVALFAPHLAVFSLAVVLLLWRSQWFMQTFGGGYRRFRRRLIQSPNCKL